MLLGIARTNLKQHYTHTPVSHQTLRNQPQLLGVTRSEILLSYNITLVMPVWKIGFFVRSFGSKGNSEHSESLGLTPVFLFLATGGLAT